MRILTLAIAGVLAISCLAHGAAAQQGPCFKTDELLAAAEKKRGGKPKWMGRTPDGKSLVFLMADSDHTWGLFVSMEKNTSCLIMGGVGSDFLIGIPV